MVRLPSPKRLTEMAVSSPVRVREPDRFHAISPPEDAATVADAVSLGSKAGMGRFANSGNSNVQSVQISTALSRSAARGLADRSVEQIEAD